MTTKSIDLSLTLRDETGFPYSTQNAVGSTDDDGITVVIPLGYLPNIETAPLTDLTANLLPLPVPVTPVSIVSRTNDYDNNTSTIVFSYS